MKLISLGKSGIHIKKKNEGKFTSYCGGKVTDACIAKAKASGNPTLVKRAVFAENARKWKHKDGGTLKFASGNALWKRNANGQWEALSDESGVKKGTIATQGTIGKDRNGNWNIFMNNKWVTDGKKFLNSDGSISTWNSAKRKFIRTGGDSTAKWDNKTNSWGKNNYGYSMQDRSLTPDMIKLVQRKLGLPQDGKWGKNTDTAYINTFNDQGYVTQQGSPDKRYNATTKAFLFTPSGSLKYETVYHRRLPKGISNSDIKDVDFNAKNPYITLPNPNSSLHTPTRYYKIIPKENFNQSYTITPSGQIIDKLSNIPIGYYDNYGNYYMMPDATMGPDKIKQKEFILYNNN